MRWSPKPSSRCTRATVRHADLRARLGRGPDQAVLLYLYNPVNPLALTGATLDAPFAIESRMEAGPSATRSQ